MLRSLIAERRMNSFLKIQEQCYGLCSERGISHVSNIEYAQHGDEFYALELFDRMCCDGIKPDRTIFSSALKACGSTRVVENGRLLHYQIIKYARESDLFFGNSLVDMYAKCGSLEEAHKVFDQLQDRDLVSWSAMIAGYARVGCGSLALELFDKMNKEGIIKPTKITFLSILKACGSIRATAEGKRIHDQLVKCGLDPDINIGNTLVDMYSKCGSLKDARNVFGDLKNRDEVSWGAMIAGYAGHGYGLYAFELFENMQEEGIKPNQVNLICILKVCGTIGSLKHGRLVHEQLMKSGLESDLIVENSLIDMYAKCGNLEEACQVFDKLPNRDVVSWGSLIARYADRGDGLHALGLFEKMQQEGVKSNRVIFLSILKACGSAGTIAQGRLIHGQITKSGLESHLMIGNMLIDMYARCRNLKEARNVFDNMRSRDVVSWGAMTAGYAMHGQGVLAFELYEKMQLEAILPNEVVFLGLSKISGSMGSLVQGRQTHDHIVRAGLESAVVIGNALVDMYLKVGSLQEACNVFCALSNRDVITWGAMIAGYAAQGNGLHALELFEKMQQEGIVPSKGTFLCILKACSSIGAIKQGRLIHDQMVKSGLEAELVIGNSVVDMYARCASIEEAHKVFNSLQGRDEVSWGTIIEGYAMHGNWRLVGQCLDKMQQQNLRLSLLIFTSILAACSNAGLLEEGCRFFRSMREDHGLGPSIEHYSCMVDLLGRAGFLNEAEGILLTMHIPPDIIIWRSLLTSCRTYGNEELGRQCFKQIVQSDPCDASGYMLMLTICADVDMWEDVDNIQRLRNFAGAWKKPGGACIEVNDKVHEFSVRGISHLKRAKTHAKLKRLDKLIKRTGFVPQVDLVT